MFHLLASLESGSGEIRFPANGLTLPDIRDIVKNLTYILHWLAHDPDHYSEEFLLEHLAFSYILLVLVRFFGSMTSSTMVRSNLVGHSYWLMAASVT